MLLLVQALAIDNAGGEVIVQLTQARVDRQWQPQRFGGEAAMYQRQLVAELLHCAVAKKDGQRLCTEDGPMGDEKLAPPVRAV